MEWINTDFYSEWRKHHSIFNSCCKENVDWISEIFEDISEQLQSSRFIECIEQLAIKYPDLNLEQDILYAKEVLI